MDITFTITATYTPTYTPTGESFDVEVSHSEFDSFDTVVERLKIDAEEAIRKVWEGEHEDDPNIGASDFEIEEEFFAEDFEFKVSHVDDDFFKEFVGYGANENDVFWEFFECDDEEALLVVLYMNALGIDFDSHRLSEAKDADYGHFDTEADFAEEFAESTGACDPTNGSWLVIDWQETFDRNLSFDFLAVDRPDGDIHIFRNS